MASISNKRISAYDITEGERDAIIQEQGGLCPGCRRPLTEDVRIEIDHRHFKVTAVKLGKKAWLATAAHQGETLAESFGHTKIDAMWYAKRLARRASVRGVLCGGRHAGCNRRLGRVDSAPWLRAMLAYIENPPARQVLDLSKRRG